MLLNEATELVAVISVVSLATERVVSILKPMVAPLVKDKYTTTVYSSMALLVSVLILMVNEITFALFSSRPWEQAIVVALACTAGSGTWNDELKILQALKVKT